MLDTLHNPDGLNTKVGLFRNVFSNKFERLVINIMLCRFTAWIYQTTNCDVFNLISTLVGRKKGFILQQNSRCRTGKDLPVPPEIEVTIRQLGGSI